MIHLKMHHGRDDLDNQRNRQGGPDSQGGSLEKGQGEPLRQQGAYPEEDRNSQHCESKGRQQNKYDELTDRPHG